MWWKGLAPVVIGAIVYGLTFAVITIEGATTWLGIPLAALVSLFGLIWGRREFGRQPLLAFFFISLLLATLFFAGWWLYWGYLPEPSKIWGF